MKFGPKSVKPMAVAPGIKEKGGAQASKGGAEGKQQEGTPLCFTASDRQEEGDWLLHHLSAAKRVAHRHSEMRQNLFQRSQSLRLPLV